MNLKNKFIILDKESNKNIDFLIKERGYINKSVTVKAALDWMVRCEKFRLKKLKEELEEGR